MREAEVAFENILMREITIGKKDGLNLLLVKRIAQAAVCFKSEITLKRTAHGCLADAKNIFDLLGLAVEHGESVLVTVKGEDAREAFPRILNTLNSA